MLRRFFELCSAASSSFKAPQHLRALLRSFFELCSAASSSFKPPQYLRALLCHRCFFELKAPRLLRAFRLRATASLSFKSSSKFARIEASLYHAKKVIEACHDVEANALLERCCHDRMVFEAFHDVEANRCHARRFLKPAMMLKPIFSFDRHVEANLTRKSKGPQKEHTKAMERLYLLSSSMESKGFSRSKRRQESDLVPSPTKLESSCQSKLRQRTSLPPAILHEA
ncbi:hypothetical protein RHGRI_030774 [Rhododendron griersonianum]|uniref:Uncharacterized protein n=1 Tax=Rhododendron griersonianum TaxID=479676 RepID=A0AAV6I8I0_9ERIC|nr:hypothetical protein RHGRI_030774 [Rhododendron griersonianum]